MGLVVTARARSAASVVVMRRSSASLLGSESFSLRVTRALLIQLVETVGSTTSKSTTLVELTAMEPRSHCTVWLATVMAVPGAMAGVQAMPAGVVVTDWNTAPTGSLSVRTTPVAALPVLCRTVTT